MIRVFTSSERLANQLKINEIREVGELVPKTEMNAPKIEKLVKKSEMDDPKVVRIGDFGELVRREEGPAGYCLISSHLAGLSWIVPSFCAPPRR